MDVKDPDSGERYWNVVNLFEICESCKALEKPWLCKHQTDRISSNKDPHKRDKTLLFYRDNQGAQIVREFFGQQSQNRDQLLLPEWIEKFHSRSVHITDAVRALYMAVDPGGGGPGELGVVAIAETDTAQGPKLVVSFSLILFFVGQRMLCGAHQADRANVEQLFG